MKIKQSIIGFFALSLILISPFSFAMTDDGYRGPMDNNRVVEKKVIVKKKHFVNPDRKVVKKVKVYDSD